MVGAAMCLLAFHVVQPKDKRYWSLRLCRMQASGEMDVAWFHLARVAQATTSMSPALFYLRLLNLFISRSLLLYKGKT